MSAAASVVDPVERILTQLSGVRQYGQGWRADCPVGHSSKGSLAIARGDDGRALLHCFASCDSTSILGALGLSIGDLFTQSDRQQLPHAERVKLRDAVAQSHWRAALGVLAREATVVQVAASMIERGEPLAPEDVQRIHVAATRIQGAREVLV